MCQCPRGPAMSGMKCVRWWPSHNSVNHSSSSSLSWSVTKISTGPRKEKYLYKYSIFGRVYLVSVHPTNFLHFPIHADFFLHMAFILFLYFEFLQVLLITILWGRVNHKLATIWTDSAFLIWSRNLRHGSGPIFLIKEDWPIIGAFWWHADRF